MSQVSTQNLKPHNDPSTVEARNEFQEIVEVELPKCHQSVHTAQIPTNLSRSQQLAINELKNSKHHIFRLFY